MKYSVFKNLFTVFFAIGEIVFSVSSDDTFSIKASKQASYALLINRGENSGIL